MKATGGGPITATVNQFAAMSGLGRTSIYELIKSGDIQSVTIGRRRLIVMESYRQLLERANAKRALGDGSVDGLDGKSTRNQLENLTTRRT